MYVHLYVQIILSFMYGTLMFKFTTNNNTLCYNNYTTYIQNKM